MKMYHVKPKKGKRDGSITLMHLGDEEFFALLDEVRDTMDMLRRLNE